MEAEFEHVSDTALLIAAARAEETERPDALVRDPFAARLAGEKGMALAHSIPPPGNQWMHFGVALRSYFIDELLRLALEQAPVDTVLNVGAGLDTRPWRLELPHELRWIEVDFPALLDYKANLMTNENPRCRLERASADLNDENQRRNVLDLAASTSAGTLIITEGLLMYLPEATLQAVAAETLARSAFRFWIFDIISPRLRSMAHTSASSRIEKLRAETHLEGEEILKLVDQTGWTANAHRSTVRDGRKIGEHRIAEIVRSISGDEMARPAPPPEDDPSGVWLYEAKRPSE